MQNPELDSLSLDDLELLGATASGYVRERHLHNLGISWLYYVIDINATRGPSQYKDVVLPV